MELTLSELQEMATRQQQQIEAQQQMLVAKVTLSDVCWVGGPLLSPIVCVCVVCVVCVCVAYVRASELSTLCVLCSEAPRDGRQHTLFAPVVINNVIIG